MRYDKWTDFAINAAVGAATGDATSSERCFNLVIRNSNGRKFDPCNSWDDAGPIIQKYRISISFDGSDDGDEYSEWVAACSLNEEHFVDYQNCDKALRAAMIVFLMMQEGK